MDEHYEQKKRMGLILTEKRLRGYGSDNSITSGERGAETSSSHTPYLQLTGCHQWDREKHRYRTYEEQVAYQKQVEANQSAAARVGRQGHHCFAQGEGYHRKKEDSKLIKGSEPAERIKARWKDK